jgi:glutamine amidotransferase
MNAVIIDYGSGNLRSAAKAFERVAAEQSISGGVQVTNDATVVLAADHIVLPGQGSFGDCLQGLKSVPGMVDALVEAVLHKGRPFLGICVGMQLMADRGLEHGVHDGLGWIPGEVTALAPDQPGLKIPHMGWSDLTFHVNDHPVLRGMEPGSHVYFVHSYAFKCAERKHLLATADYGGEVAAVVGRNNLIGTQFHPEKSQAAGLRLIANFLRWRP